MARENARTQRREIGYALRQILALNSEDAPGLHPIASIVDHPVKELGLMSISRVMLSTVLACAGTCAQATVPIITTVAGGGSGGATCCAAGDGGPANSAQLDGPNGVFVDSAGNLFIADTANNLIRKVSMDGIITTVAGNGTCGNSGTAGHT